MGSEKFWKDLDHIHLFQGTFGWRQEGTAEVCGLGPGKGVAAPDERLRGLCWCHHSVKPSVPVSSCRDQHGALPGAVLAQVNKVMGNRSRRTESPLCWSQAYDSSSAQAAMRSQGHEPQRVADWDCGCPGCILARDVSCNNHIPFPFSSCLHTSRGPATPWLSQH